MAQILIISPTPSHPQDAGNRARIFSLLSGLKACGHRIHFAFVAMEVGDDAAMAANWDGFYSIPYRRPFDRWQKRMFDKWSATLNILAFLPYGIDDWFTPEISRQLGALGRRIRPDVVLVEYVFLSKVFDDFGPETLKVLDTHDVFGGRHRLFLENGIAPQWFYTTISQENKALDRADVVLAIQQEEAACFSHRTIRKVLPVGHMTPVHSVTTVAHDRLLFVGSANQLNVSAVQWFLEEVFPPLQDERPELEFEIVGKCAESIQPAKGLVLTGPVADLVPCYQRAKVVVNPIRFGTGLKIKTVEALAHGRPLVTTSAGVAGLIGEIAPPCVVADTPGSFAEGILNFLKSPELCREFGCAALEFVNDYNQRALVPLLAEIDGWIEKKQRSCRDVA